MNWTALFGQYTERKNEIVFKGQEVIIDNEAPRSAYANLMTDQYFSGGKISAEISFKKIHTKLATQCEIIIYYDPDSRNFLSAGLGGSFNMYSIRSFTNKWEDHAVSGSYSNLKANKVYKVEVEVKGSKVILTVDGIIVLLTTLPFVVPISQVGIFCLGTDEIIIKNYKIHSVAPKAFVVMQFSSPFNELYQDVIKPICDEFKLNVLRADETYGPGLIIADITKEISESRIVIAEVSPLNSNVYYEVGYAHALNKPTILIAEKTVKLPFDVSPFRTLFYENSIAGKKQVEEGFRKHIKAVLSDRELLK
ncbi:MAG: hypothetical protein K2X69_07025 [Silvanigrellaceae bacterium]|nr:hypothetical protein [Silvanigrellaceae bacterium]